METDDRDPLSRHTDELLDELNKKIQELHDLEEADPDDMPKMSALAKKVRKLREAFGFSFDIKHKKYLSYSKEELFPTQWMLKDETISAIIESHPAFIPLLNYLHNRSRYWRGRKFLAMVEQADRLTKGRRYLNEHKFSTFLTNAAFYDEATKALGISKNIIQRYLAAFVKIGIFKLLADAGRNGRLYADGYFVETGDNRLRKISFCKNTKEIKGNKPKDGLPGYGLRNLPEYIKNYQPFQI